jgi:hypothetical protein
MKTPNYGSILDSRDLAKRKEELEALRDEVEETRKALDETAQTGSGLQDLETAYEDAQKAFGEDEQKELSELEEAEIEIPEWGDGNTLIPSDEWISYVQDLLDDIGDIPKNLPHYIVIDWEKTADNLEADYSRVTIQGTEYLYRNC